MCINEQVGERRNTVGTHTNADCVVENMSTNHNKYVVNKKISSILMIIVSENVLVEAGLVFTK
jgi:hypothetical protein